MNLLAKNYANAFYSLAKDEGIEKDILSDLSVVTKLFSDNDEYVSIMNSPMIALSEREKMLDDAFSKSVSPYTLNLLKILVSKKSLNLVFECEKIFVALYNKDNNIEKVTAVTAIPLSKRLSEKLTDRLFSVLNKTVILENVVDKSLIGGIMLRYENKQTDSSIRNRLMAIEKTINSDN